ncbi:serine/threonine-protein kinase BRSK2-like isoform X3 [Tachypleus tridentatus]|uniref:serine/threonine-protein kinase BRSK2-like isoform X3 n=1 Tax=Tachypleus tridentatus TaxID=6853 RepID=UPI003FD670CB
MSKLCTRELANDTHQYRFVGPYRLEKTLGKGQTGLVKLGIHCLTGTKVAVKIVNREKLSESVSRKVEREIAIMKMIEHPHVLKLYDVYENKKYLYLVLEHVSGGELFDYLLKKRRLPAKEARKFLWQIISALDFCHKHCICHRDLKPENLLLDDQNNIRIADFGMACLQVEGTMLETSCGSPHYASPEVIRGEKYDGRRADVWSCGVITFAMIVGSLPFDDKNLRILLEKVKRGVFHIPEFVPHECQELLKGMIEVDPEKRMTLSEVMKHPWINGGSRTLSKPEYPITDTISTYIIPTEEDMDTDVLRNMMSLGCFKNKPKLLEGLLNASHNTEKVIYLLLLHRKEKEPSCEDDHEIIDRNVSESADPRKKRVDSCKMNGKLRPRYSLDHMSHDSPLSSRRIPYRPKRSYSTAKSYTNKAETSSLKSPRPVVMGTTCETLSGMHPNSPDINQATWKSRLNTTRNSFLGSPRFHRRKLQTPSSSDDTGSDSLPELTKKSWFTNLTGGERDESRVFLVKEVSLGTVKAKLVLSFLSIADLTHTVLSHTTFQMNYHKSETEANERNYLQRDICFKADASVLPNTNLQLLTKDSVNGKENSQTLSVYCICFILVSGSVQLFKRVCDQIQEQLLKRYRNNSSHISRSPTADLVSDSFFYCDNAFPGIVKNQILGESRKAVVLSENTVKDQPVVESKRSMVLSLCRSVQHITSDILMSKSVVTNKT